MKAQEQTIRIARIPEIAHPLPSGYWGSDASARAEWAAIAIALQTGSRVPSYHLYWLGADDTMLDLMDYEPMAAARLVGG